MDSFHSEDFADAIDDMCDDAVRRMYAFQEGGLSVMKARDAYYSRIIKRDELLEVVEYETITRTSIEENIHPDIVQNTLPDYLSSILSGAVIVLARHASFRGRGSDVIEPNHDMATERVRERLLLGKTAIESSEAINIVRYDLGSLGATNLVLGPNDGRWDLFYEARHRTALIRFQ